MPSSRRFAAALLATALLSPSPGVTAPPETVRVERVIGGLDLPTDLAFAGDGRLLVSEKEGRIVVVENGVVTGVLLDIEDRVVSGFDEGEQGLLSLALHPAFATNGYLFVSYTDDAGASIVSRFDLVPGDPPAADPASERVLLRIDQPGMNHNVHALRFGPDGYLYIGSGDGSFAAEPLCTSQEGDSLHGKILRLDVDQGAASPPYHAIPATNPFVGADGVRDEIWALGLRNPWRFSFDRLTGDLLIGDPGQSLDQAREEINLDPASSGGGRNYGWKMMEGTLCRGSSAGCSTTLPPCGAPAYTPPVIEYLHDAVDRCAVVGGYVYRGQAIPALAGRYVFGDFCGQLWTASTDQGWALEPLEPPFPGLVTFGEDDRGELYLATLNGEVLAVADLLAGDAEAGAIAFEVGSLAVDEGAGSFPVRVARTGSLAGPVSARIVSENGWAVAGVDFAAVNAVVSWEDGEGGPRTVTASLIDDAEPEGAETFVLRIAAAAGGLEVAEPARLTVTVADDDLPSVCVPDTATLCLRQGRFLVRASWRTALVAAGVGTAVPITSDGGWFYFFRDTNPEVFVKVLDACANHGFFWVFAGGMTDVGTRLLVIDTSSGAVATYDSGRGEPFGTLRDTRAFATCP